MADPLRLSLSARMFVAVVFLALAAAFLASTALVLIEFRDLDPWVVLSAYSNHFVYFPTFGLVALAAFYVPAVIFTDLYWRGRVNGGRFRFWIGFFVVAGLTWGATELLNATQLRPIWEIAPRELAGDFKQANVCAPSTRGEPPGHKPDVLPQCRPTLLGTAIVLRTKALDRMALSPLARECTPDNLLEPPPDFAAARYCFPAHARLDTKRCCEMQSRLASRALDLWTRPGYRSQSAELDRWIFLPAKSFFVIVIVLIGVLLVFRKPRLVEHYGSFLPAMEKGLLLGALAMLPWLLMDYAQQQVADVLYGAQSGFPFRYSLVLVPWALLLTGYFADRIQLEFVRAVQVASGVISAVAILNYRSVFDLSAKVFGVGAPDFHFYLMIGLSVVSLIYLLFWIPKALRGEERGRDAVSTETPKSDAHYT